MIAWLQQSNQLHYLIVGNRMLTDIRIQISEYPFNYP